ncbi:hypothetical protein Syun_009049 [Stephania yunnanensis]|uniref:Uncharacterized protein n=1 Tax=Stephania yunnanensis TaxID=152371 RepID=A0AAP0KEV6_9MAGN
MLFIEVNSDKMVDKMAYGTQLALVSQVVGPHRPPRQSIWKMGRYILVSERC